MSKLGKVRILLKDLGFPPAQQAEVAVYTLLALSQIKPTSNWNSATNNWIRIHDVIEFSREYYGKEYAENSRETIRKQCMHPFREAALIEDNERMKPKEIFADAVTASKDSILIGDLAKILKQKGIDIGQNRLFQKLRNNGYLIQRRGPSWNMPTQKSMEMGLFEVEERTITNPDGTTKIRKTTKVTGKGQQYFINKLLAAS